MITKTLSYTLHLRSPGDRGRLDEFDRVSAIHKITRHVESFVLTDGKGFIDCCFEDVLLIHLATDCVEQVLELADDLRRTFHFESIGIDVAGYYLEASAETTAKDLQIHSPIDGFD